MKLHSYKLRTEWTGNLGTGTSGYREYARNHDLYSPGKTARIQGSSDPRFRGDPSRYNPEELLVGSLAACHMLFFLHLCADAGIVVTAYDDESFGSMQEHEDGSGDFTEVVLAPRVTIATPGREGELDNLHHRAHELCFIARSVRFPVAVRPRTTIVKTL